VRYQYFHGYARVDANLAARNGLIFTNREHLL
jgi:hypothetical protein